MSVHSGKVYASPRHTGTQTLDGMERIVTSGLCITLFYLYLIALSKMAVMCNENSDNTSNLSNSAKQDTGD